jgi:hypothetical protein
LAVLNGPLIGANNASAEMLGFCYLSPTIHNGVRIGIMFINMKGEQYRPPEQEEWKREVVEDVERIMRIPESILRSGPVYEVQTKLGETLKCETFELNLEAANHIVGTRFTSLFISKLFPGQIRASSIIRVVKKGEGYASPIEEAFQRQLQAFADKVGKPIVWEISNDNLDKLKDYQSGTDVDEDVLQKMEQEQERWQTLYGKGGKLGIEKGKKTFTPSGA